MTTDETSTGRDLWDKAHPRAPAGETNLQKALREQFLAMAAEPMTEGNMQRIARAASAAAKVLSVVTRPDLASPERPAFECDVDGDSPSSYVMSGLSGGISNPAETFGARTIRELMSALPDIVRMQHQTPGQLVNAIAEARGFGMTDVAAELEKKLTGRALDGERPLKPAVPFPMVDLSKVAHAAVAETLDETGKIAPEEGVVVVDGKAFFASEGTLWLCGDHEKQAGGRRIIRLANDDEGDAVRMFYVSRTRS